MVFPIVHIRKLTNQTNLCWCTWVYVYPSVDPSLLKPSSWADPHLSFGAIFESSYWRGQSTLFYITTPNWPICGPCTGVFSSVNFRQQPQIRSMSQGCHGCLGHLFVQQTYILWTCLTPSQIYHFYIMKGCCWAPLTPWLSGSDSTQQVTGTFAAQWLDTLRSDTLTRTHWHFRTYFPNGLKCSCAGGVALLQSPWGLDCKFPLAACQAPHIVSFPIIVPLEPQIHSKQPPQQSACIIAWNCSWVVLRFPLRVSSLLCYLISKRSSITKSRICWLSSPKWSTSHCASLLVVKGAKCHGSSFTLKGYPSTP